MNGRGVHVFTLGCDKNLVDSEALLGRFAARGMAISDRARDARVWVLNTCGFIDAARRDGYRAIADLSARKGDRILVVTGCLAQRDGPDLQRRFPGIDVLGGVGNFDRLVAAVEQGRSRVPTTRPGRASYEGLAGRPLLTPRHLAYLKISEGCNFRCAFCSIPSLRGDQRSRPVSELTAEAQRLAARGVRELVVVAQNSSDFGRDSGENLAQLLAALGRVEGIAWLRLLYLYPGLLSTEELLRILELPAVLPYLDLPVQHASPQILRRMNRPHDIAALQRQLLGLRRERPELVLRTTLLLGFPGEEEADVELVADLLAAVEFDHVGTYRYSPETGTPAASLDGRPDPEEVADREARLLDLQHDIALKRQRSRLGKTYTCVVDGVEPGADWSSALAACREGAVVPDPAGGWGGSPGDVPAQVAVARSHHFGYDLDGAVLLPATGLRPGMTVEARFVAVSPYDVIGAFDDVHPGR